MVLRVLPVVPQESGLSITELQSTANSAGTKHTSYKLQISDVWILCLILDFECVVFI
jgi:hypothetical protein